MLTLPDSRDPVTLYHFVRNIPYGGIGQRRIEDVLESGRGSCSGKHLLLQKLLCDAGHKAGVATIFTWFDRGIPKLPALPPALLAMLEDGEIPDFHHYVELELDGVQLKLDATWHDGLTEYGFPVNDRWDGDGDSILAAPVIDYFPPQADLAAFKANKIAALHTIEQVRRAQFFQGVSDWITGLLEKEKPAAGAFGGRPVPPQSLGG